MHGLLWVFESGNATTIAQNILDVHYTDSLGHRNALAANADIELGFSRFCVAGCGGVESARGLSYDSPGYFCEE